VLPDEQPQLKETECKLMSNLSEDIRELQATASVLCAQCLRDEIAVRAESLDELTSRLETAARGEQRYLDAFGKVMAAVLVLATFTAELTKRPADTWVLHVSPN
jgi:hypothetical protein